MEGCVSCCSNPRTAKFCLNQFCLVCEKLPVITGPVKLFCFPFIEGSFKSFENYTVELLANETKWTSLEVRTHPTFLETLI